MASPHIAGVVALAIAEGNFTSVEEIHDYVRAMAFKDRVEGSFGKTPNSLSYKNVMGGKRPNDDPVELKLGEDEPNEPGNGECPFLQCLFVPSGALSNQLLRSSSGDCREMNDQDVITVANTYEDLVRFQCSLQMAWERIREPSVKRELAFSFLKMARLAHLEESISGLSFVPV
ncbi:hypothetical protein HDV00_010830 [Rhizophlyctis rosea]|nr:hypothetical protein HDV00_010830 [Rhizophlyctis rosea]